MFFSRRRTLRKRKNERNAHQTKARTDLRNPKSRRRERDETGIGRRIRRERERRERREAKMIRKNPGKVRRKRRKTRGRKRSTKVSIVINGIVL